MELGAIVRGVLRRWVTVLLTLALAVGVAVGVSLALPVRYRALTTVFVSTTGQDLYAGGSFARDRVKSYAQAIPMPMILEPVISALDLELTSDELAKRVSTSVPLDSVLIDISVADTDPQRAAEIADAIAEEFSAAVPRLENPDEQTSPVTVSVLRSATVPTEPFSPNIPRNILAGLAIGLALGVVLAAIREQSDTRLRSEERVREVFDVPVIGTLRLRPKNADPLVVETDPVGREAEAYRSLRSNLQFFSADQALKTIVVTSSNPQEGKSTVAANLALVMGETEERICLVEADLRRPRALNYLGMDASAGLTNVLIGETRLQDVLQPVGGRNLTVLGAGRVPPNPSELLGSHAMDALIAALTSRFDRVIFDTPPLLSVTDASVLAQKVDGVALVVGTDVAIEDDVTRCREHLDRIHATLLGFVLTGVKRTAQTSYESYSDDPGPRPPRARARPRRSRGSR
ncbi:MAG: polysaccharide biosynthesis tyrosine autokinase [Propionibacteriaceae bacterium]|nr:polysaccharide biosynthesis tyrosine autokinase [Propionibacteriaceae bacterium]